MIKKILFLFFVCASAVAYSSCAQFEGWYVGANIGWGHDDYQFDDLEGFALSVDDDLPRGARVEDDGVIGGVQIGYNWQCCCSVLGIEADWNATSLRPTVLTLDGDQPDGVDSARLRNRMHWFGTVRGRAGVVVDCLLLYATAGFAYAHTKQTWSVFEDDPAGTETFRRSHVRVGGVGGFGAEWALGCRWSIKAEVLYIHFGQDRKSFTSELHNPGIRYRFQSHESLTVGRVGVNYRWGCPY